MRIRPYQATDREACLALFDSNVPTHFHTEERPGFESFLDAPDGEYLVLEFEGEIVGCGGWARRASAPGVADLCWGIVRASHHGKGLGRALLEARLAGVRSDPGIRFVSLRTSQHTEGFFARYGFVTRSVVRDGFAPGLDEHDMWLDLGR